MRGFNVQVVPQEWSNRLAITVCEALSEFAPSLGDTPVVLFAVDCHPWNGFIGLSLLTDAEAAADPLLLSPSEMAAWEHYDFAAKFRSWGPTVSLGGEMRRAYELSGARETVAIEFLQACSLAMLSPEVTAGLGILNQAEAFRISVAHADTGVEYCQTRP